MEKLKPFNNLSLPFEVFASIEKRGTALSFQFELRDPKKLVQIPVLGSEYQQKRTDGLWKSTCFEIFILPESQENYYEVNLSPNLDWNIYQFDSYRKPQPPTPSFDLQLSQMNWDKDRQILQGKISGDLLAKPLKIGLTAVIKLHSGESKGENNSEIHYLAIQHAGDKPDFHNSDSFILIRN